MEAQPQFKPTAPTPGGPPAAVPSGPPRDEVTLGTKRSRFSIKMAGASLGGLVFSAGLVLAGVVALTSRGTSPERALALSGGLALLVAFAAGFAGAAASRKVGTWEVFTTGAVFTAVASVWLGRVLYLPYGTFRPFLSDIAYLANLFGPNPAGGVAVAAVALWGATFIGSSLGFMLAGSGKLDLGYSYELRIAERHLRLSKPEAEEEAGPGVPGWYSLLFGLGEARRAGASKKSPTKLMTGISIGGVAVGVLALTVVLSVMSGFELDLKNKIIGTNAHAVVLKYGNDFSEWPTIAEGVRHVRGVTGVTPFILNEVMVSSDQNIGGALVKGIEASTVAQVANLPANITEGRLEWLDRPEAIPTAPKGFKPRAPLGVGQSEGEQPPEPPPAEGGARPEGKVSGELTEDDILRPKAAPQGEAASLPGIILGKELAHGLKVMVGDRINVVSPLGGELGPTGPMPKSRPFKVAGIFFSGMYEYDAKFAYISLKEAQSFFGLGSSVTGLEMKTNDIDNTRQITREVLDTLDGYPYRTKDWGEMNKNLFSALRLEKLVMAVILGFIVLVACFNIISTLIMMVLEKSKEIAILKSMGATDTSVMKVFVLEGLIIGLIGTAVGLTLGLLVCLFIDRVGIHLDAEVYYIDKLPVKISALQFAAVAGLAVLLSYLATIYPATRASRMPPVDGLRNE